ncbi:MAG: histidine phosphatase family protein [Oscillatoriales cyanobacterium RM2_1_1]|nr:histidine phosphatase family protein [Oscillatoriales cyanobacterium SM2_3_0]NJO45589.1 histidine phosphatase family protein [Oscillatoriales cyanobacterium RM2_1_1]
MTTRVILVRHGQSTYNAQHRIQGRLDASVLTESGCEAACKVGDTLASLAFDVIYCSPLQRAQKTAELIRNRLQASPPLESTELLLEVDLPLWEGMERQAVIDQFPQDYQRWHEHPEQFYMTISRGEEEHQHFPVLELFEQARNFWLEILAKHADQTLLIVAHNGINRCLIATALGIQPQFYQSIQQSNCGISILNFSEVVPGEFPQPATVQLESLNLTQHLGQVFPSPRSGHQGPRLLLVRHGETEWNRQGQFQGQIDVPLNDNGRQQGEKVADFLQSVPLDLGFSSPMSRPQETAKIILRHHPDITLQLDDDLKEISHGLWEGKFEAEIDQAYPGLLQQWKTAPETVQMPAGENLQQVWIRAIAAWTRLVQSIDQQPLVGIVVAHDAVNKAILCQLFGLSPEHFWNFKQGNGAVSVIDYPEGLAGKPVLQAINITTHLTGSVLDQTAAGAL